MGASTVDLDGYYSSAQHDFNNCTRFYNSNFLRKSCGYMLNAGDQTYEMIELENEEYIRHLDFEINDQNAITYFDLTYYQ